MAKKIKAPFNFIPLNGRVYFPDWANQISQDIPFSDGVSGYIDVNVEALSPIFIRNGHTKDEEKKNSTSYRSFNQVKDNFFIPATSLKGEIRSLVEIMSFGKLRLDKRAQYAQREWNNSKVYTIKDPKAQKEILCGWLREDKMADEDNRFVLTSSGSPMRISHTELDIAFGKNIMSEYFSKGSRFDLNKQCKLPGSQDSYDPKTAKFKYDLLVSEEIDINKYRTFELLNNDGKSHVWDKVMVSDSKYGIRGDIVLTGQPDQWKQSENRKVGDGKFYEFVFKQELNPEEYYISETTMEHYSFIYEKSEEWKRIKSQIQSERGTPVFFRVENGQVKDFGFALLYKLPYDKTPHESLPDQHKQKEFDLADCMFGPTTEDSFLKGRIQFSHAFSNNAEKDKEVKLVLGSPKASYYPIYIRQDNRQKGYKTYNDGHPSGWKRYHFREKTWAKVPESDSVATTIYPLKAGATFQGKVYFHNLRPVELGALLSALTFHGNSSTCYHQLGQAAPYGFGKCRYEVELHCDGLTAKKYMGIFEDAMNASGIVGGEWTSSPSIVELFTMSNSIVDDNDTFKYMTLSMSGINEFEDAKNDKAVLESYSLGVQKFQIGSMGMTVEERLQQKKDTVRTKIDEIYGAEGDLDKRISELSNFESDNVAEYGVDVFDEEIRNVINGYITLLKELKNKEEENEKNKKIEERKELGLANELEKVTSIGNFSGKLKKWIKDCGELTESDFEVAVQKLMELKSKSKDDWTVGKGNYNKLKKDCGEEIASRLFDALNE